MPLPVAFLVIARVLLGAAGGELNGVRHPTTRGRIACRARIDLSSGFAGDVRAVLVGAGTIEHRGGATDGRSTTVEVDVSLDASRGVGDIEPDLCAEARGILRARGSDLVGRGVNEPTP